MGAVGPRGIGQFRSTLRMGLSDGRDDVAEGGHGLQVAERGEPLQAECIELIAQQKGHIRLDIGRRVVQATALGNHLDQELVLGLMAGRARPG